MTENILTVLLTAGAKEGQNPIMTFLPLILIVVVFYFFMIRPQVKKQKEMQKFRQALQKGDQVVTIGGVYGKIIDVQDNAVIIEVENKMQLKVDKNAINQDSTGMIGQK